MRVFFVLLLCVLGTPIGLAEWQVVAVTGESSVGALVIHRHVALVDSTTDQHAALDLATFFPRNCTLRLIENENGDTTLAGAMEREKCLAGVNGGYFDPEFAPIGLRVGNGKTIAPLQRAKLLTGLLAASANHVQILRTREFSRELKPLTAIQSGPFLVDGGERVRGLDESRPARRTFAVIATDRQVAIGVCSEVSLAKLAEILIVPGLAQEFKIQRALNLDGGSSTAFWFARQNGDAFSIPEQKPVRDFIGIIRR